jgi:hypothetical protein
MSDFVKGFADAMDRNDDAAAKAALVALGGHVIGLLESIALSLETMASAKVSIDPETLQPSARG